MRIERLVMSPGFAIGLALLLANDLVLKRAFHNVATGKLSDFAGIWLVTLLVMVAAPRRIWLSAVLIGLGFAIWKSPLVQPAIDAWNLSGLPTVWREPDPTDLIALAIMPAAIGYAQRRLELTAQPVLARRRAGAVMLGGLTLFAFAATQRAGDHVCCSGAFEAPFGQKELLARLATAGARSIRHTREMSDERGDWYSFALPEQMCGERVHVNVRLSERDGRTAIITEYILYNCPEQNDASVEDRLRSFMNKVIAHG